jgi:hypothetical protein
MHQNDCYGCSKERAYKSLLPIGTILGIPDDLAILLYDFRVTFGRAWGRLILRIILTSIQKPDLILCNLKRKHQ